MATPRTKRRIWREVTKPARTLRKPSGAFVPNPPPVAVVRRAYFEGNSFEVIDTPKMIPLAQGFETEESAQEFATDYNNRRKDKTNGPL